MIFVNAWLWIFLPLAAIPIILHLLTLFRLRTVELSTYRFLFDSYVQQRRRMQFLEALLAMLRTLFLLAPCGRLVVTEKQPPEPFSDPHHSRKDQTPQSRAAHSRTNRSGRTGARSGNWLF